VVDTVVSSSAFARAVRAIIATTIVGGILSFGRELIEIVALAFDPVIEAIELATVALLDAGRPAGSALLEALLGWNRTVATVTGSAGPLAPIISTALIVGIAYLTYRLLVSLAGDVPVLGAALRFLGIDP
jgi:hypothetical protein